MQRLDTTHRKSIKEIIVNTWSVSNTVLEILYFFKNINDMKPQEGLEISTDISVMTY